MGLEQFDELARLVDEARNHYQQLMNGKDIAGTRARKALQGIKRIAHEMRMEIQKTRAARSDEKPGGGQPTTPP